MLRIRDLRSSFFGPIDLEVAAGECIAIRGASGAGKSLLLRAIADLDPNEGEVVWNGLSREAMPAPKWRRRVGLVPAESGWWADRVGDHFESPMGSTDLLDAVGMPVVSLDWDVERLSTGERHRLAIVRCLALRPAVLLLDEPTAALDGEATERVEDLLKRQLEGGVAMLIVTHDAGQPRRMAARVTVMEAGRLAAPPEVTA